MRINVSIGNQQSDYEPTCSIRAAREATRRVESMVGGVAPRVAGNKQDIVFYLFKAVLVLYITR